MSVLTEINEILTDVFSDTELFFYPATLTRVNKTNPIAWGPDAGAPLSYDCLAIEIGFDEKLRPNFPDAETTVLVLQQTLGTSPEEMDVINIPERGDRVVVGFNQDPASATWELYTKAPDGNNED